MARAPEWGAPPEDYVVADGEVHLWRFSLEPHDTAAVDFVDLLSPDERARAQRFFFAENRRRYVIGRGWLRVILGRYARRPSKQLAFRYGPRGKPYLAPSTEVRPICFNLAHSESLMLVAVTRACAVGVDLERLRAVGDAEVIASRFFSRRERAAIKAEPPSLRAAKFLRVWTGKEACVKAVGRGLDDDLAQIDISELGLQSDGSVCLPDETGRMAHCWLTEVVAGDDHVAAVAVVSDAAPATIAAAG